MAKKHMATRYFIMSFSATVFLLILVFVPVLINLSKSEIANNTIDYIPYEDTKQSDIINKYQKSLGDCVNIAFAVTKDESLSLLYLIRLNPYNDKITLTSVPVNTFVTDSTGTHTLQQNFHSSGITGVVSSLENLFSTKIEKHAYTSSENFASIVDYIGTLEYSIPYNLEYENDETSTYFHIPKGKQSFDGKRLYSLLIFPFEEEGELHRNKLQTDTMAKYFNQQLNSKFSINLESNFIFFINKIKSNISYTDYSYYKTPVEYLIALNSEVTEPIFLNGQFGKLGFTPEPESLEVAKKYFSIEQ